MVFGDQDSYMQKNETQPPTYTKHKNKLKMDKRLIWTSGQDGGIGRYTLPPCTTKRRTTNLKTKK